MVRCRTKRSGPARKYDRNEILEGIRLGLSNITIAEVVGCTPRWVGELRNKEMRRKKRLCEGRVC